MTIAKRIEQIQRLIVQTAKKTGRDHNSIHLLAVSKGQTIGAIEAAYSAGISHFAENYLQEAQRKMKALRALPITWHFIGPVQSNKAGAIAEEFDWVHTVSREKIARLLSSHRPHEIHPLNLCLQVNLDHEPTKSGVFAEELSPLALVVQNLPNIKLRGLMSIPKAQCCHQQQYQSFLKLNQLFRELNPQLDEPMDSLSMGMSDDFVAAIEAGSTMVRIGRAIFGKRS